VYLVLALINYSGMNSYCNQGLSSAEAGSVGDLLVADGSRVGLASDPFVDTLEAGMDIPVPKASNQGQRAATRGGE